MAHQEYSYEGLFIQELPKELEEKIDELKEKGVITPEWKETKNLHVTLSHSGKPMPSKRNGIFGQEASLNVKELAYSKDSVGLLVELNPSKDRTSRQILLQRDFENHAKDNPMHVTIANNEGIKPYQTRELFEGDREGVTAITFEEPITLESRYGGFINGEVDIEPPLTQNKIIDMVSEMEELERREDELVEDGSLSENERAEIEADLEKAWELRETLSKVKPSILVGTIANLVKENEHLKEEVYDLVKGFNRLKELAKENHELNTTESKKEPSLREKVEERFQESIRPKKCETFDEYLAFALSEESPNESLEESMEIGEPEPPRF